MTMSRRRILCLVLTSVTIVPYNYVNPGGDTFFSGNMISETGDEQPEWLLTVNNTDPIFFYWYVKAQPYSTMPILT